MGGLGQTLESLRAIDRGTWATRSWRCFDTLKLTDARRRPDRFTTLLLIAGSIHNHGPSWTPLAEQWSRALEALLMPIETGSLGAGSDRPAQIEAMQRSRIADAMIQSHSE